MKFYIVFLLHAFIVYSAQALDDQSSVMPRDEAVILVHGLNNPPSIMRDIGDFVEQLGFKTAYVTLQGHDPKQTQNLNQNLKKITAMNWYNDVEQVYTELSKAHDKIHLIAFSLGASVAIGLQLKRHHIQFEKSILFAPAIATRSYTSLVKTYGKISGNVPSFATPRVHASLNKKYYDVLFEIQKYIKTSPVPSFTKLNREAYVFVNVNDPLVSLGKTRKFAAKKGLDQWRIENLSTNTWNGHQILKKSWLGPKNWNVLEAKIKDYLTTN